MIFVFDTDEALIDTSCTLVDSTTITPNEIAQIDNELRKEIKATFTGPDYKHYTAVNYTFPSITF